MNCNLVNHDRCRTLLLCFGTSEATTKMTRTTGGFPGLCVETSAGWEQKAWQLGGGVVQIGQCRCRGTGGLSAASECNSQNCE